MTVRRILIAARITLVFSLALIVFAATLLLADPFALWERLVTIPMLMVTFAYGSRLLWRGY